MASRYNEGKAIDAVLRRIEARDRVLRLNDGRSPDDLNDPDPLRRVDYVCTIGNALYAFEHTGIEPFANQIELEVHNQKLFATFDAFRGQSGALQPHGPNGSSVPGRILKVNATAVADAAISDTKFRCRLLKTLPAAMTSRG
jgi:hypothetical protein